eukprot:gnl/MRDRNA2_/MRDRNA2_89390_c0_seq1.p1 gnl/MRDRNA2_/MRDRNA2_89390_c0~~gnl/MRDRNA2_/MRDRNA2_89390_c0_seq1.p1  ORF type:complete len:293 (-),score=59.93 gnl/MRDRNA2_/MRDRNA2_89390_c0_seq1:440-1318(-)
MPLGYLQEPTPRTPPSASGNMRIGVKNTFIEVMPPATEPTQRAVTTPAEMGYSGASSSMDHQNQQMQQQLQPAQQHARQPNQQQIQQQTGDARNQMHMNQSPTAYIDPATGVVTQGFGMPVQMVAIPYMTQGQEGYPNVQFVDPSMMPQMANNVTSDGGMQTYDFSAAHAQGAYFMPMTGMTHAQFVPMNMSQMPMMEVPASNNEQNGNNNFENQQYHQGPMAQSHHHNNNGNMIAKEKRPMGGNGKTFKQKEIQSANVHEGPKAVLVDLSKLRPVNKAAGSQVRSSWYKHF